MHDKKESLLKSATARKLVNAVILIGGAIGGLHQWMLNSRTANLEQEVADQRATIRVLVQNCKFAGSYPVQRSLSTSKSFGIAAYTPPSTEKPLPWTPLPMQSSAKAAVQSFADRLEEKLCEVPK